MHRALLAASHAQLGNAKEADRHVQEVLKLVPDFTIQNHCPPVLHYRRESDHAHQRESLRKAGLPD